MSEGSRLATGDARGRLVAIAGTAAAECAEAANSPVSSAPLGQDLGSMLAHAYGGSRTVRFGRNRDVVVAGDAHDCFCANHDGWLVRYKILHRQVHGPDADTFRDFAGELDRLADADPAVRARAEAAFVPPLRIGLSDLRKSVHPQDVTLETLPKDLLRAWLMPDGRARVEILPKGDAENSEVLSEFARAVLSVEPNATGPAISFNEAGRTIVRAFVQAGCLALLGIAILLLISLRRLVDVLLTLVPLLLAGAVTLELCVLIGLALNFANIIALPLLLGVGVAFKIYYIMAWRAGQTRLLESTLTRAVVFSGMTTATAFGSLWASNSPGMSSMGQLMALSLACTMMAAVLFQPVFMGPPRRTE